MNQFFADNTLVLLLSVGTIFSIYWLWRHKADLRLTTPAAVALAVLHTFMGVAAVKIFAVLETLDFSVAGAMSLFGAIFFLPLLYFGGAKLFKRSIAKTCDIFTPCMVICVMLARVNCILSGCCLGKYIPGQAPQRWPTREIELVFYIILLLWIIRKDGEVRPPGFLYPIYMVGYGALRFVLEGFRVSESRSVFHVAHLWAGICFVLGLSIYFELRKRIKEKEERKR